MASAPPNFHLIESPEHLQEILSKDLSVVSVIYFRAEWAEPCRGQMDDVQLELAKSNPGALFLQVEAEAQPEISESFEVDAVPYFILLRGHTLLTKISGAQPSLLAEQISKYTSPAALSQSSYTPLSKTDQTPQPAPTTYIPATSSGKDPQTGAPLVNGKEDIVVDEKEESPEELAERCKGLMNQHKLMLFMKGNPNAPRCGFSQQTVNILRDQGLEFGYFDILQDEAVRQELKKINSWPTFPQIVVNGELIGGLDILKEMVDSGELKEVIA